MTPTDRSRHSCRSTGRRRLSFLLILLAGTIPLVRPATSGAQDYRPNVLERMRNLPDRIVSDRNPGSGQRGERVRWSVETPISPDTYRVVPGDHVNLGIWGENPLPLLLDVTPEGELVVPKVGPVSVAGLTLREAERRVQQELRSFYPKAKITLRLLEPGVFRVAVTGMVAEPGIYEVIGVDRITTAIDAAGGIRPGGSLRQIHLRPQAAETGSDLATADRSGSMAGSSEKMVREIDLLPWLLEGDLSANPFLEPGLVIEVPEIQRRIRVRGPVNGRSTHLLVEEGEAGNGDRPTEDLEIAVEWREGDSLDFLLSQVGGLSSRATTGGMLHRTGEDPRTVDLIRPEDLAILLQPDDILEIRHAPRWVSIIGAVESPGRYPYYPGFTAREYVSLAGGESELGRSSGWRITLPSGGSRDAGNTTLLEPGMTLKVPERRTYQLTKLLAPFTGAAALVLSIVAIANR